MPSSKHSCCSSNRSILSWCSSNSNDSVVSSTNSANVSPPPYNPSNDLMANSSSKDTLNNPSCFHCKSTTTAFTNGWKLKNGTFAQLCYHCGSAYENGKFCETFHKEFDGWRDCAICKKMLHCGCIVSEKDIVMMDYGGVCCMDCAQRFLKAALVDKIILPSQALKLHSTMT
ncbi:hypothetical protein RJT34_29128 [Clitoria ternatea]|uniref:VAL1-3 N-terminal zinc finger domain-containing protein n=1 Tax=Clitoria ternatea TaxID=43366 RepID=A0AAN9ICZ7_CLITE